MRCFLFVLCAALLGVSNAHGASGESEVDALGQSRLFLSADERWLLDQARRDLDKKVEPVAAKPKRKPKPKIKPAPKKPKALPAVKLQGYVKRSSGESTVWINNGTSSEGQTTKQELQLISAGDRKGNVHIKMPDKSLITLKPGQRFDPNGKRIVDAVE